MGRWLDDLTKGEWGHLLRLLETPSLWAFALLAGRLGLPEAVEACDQRDELPEEVRAILYLGDYQPGHLPSGEEIRLTILGCRIAWRREREEAVYRQELADICRDLKVSPVELLRAQDIYMTYRLQTKRA